jgi:serine protease Do
MKVFLISIVAFLLVILPAGLAKADAQGTSDAGENIYRAYSGAVYQIQTIDVATGKKSSIGSGFQISADGLMATNYHVIAAALQRPQENKLEYLKENGQKGPLSIIYADVVNDVSLVQLDHPGPTYLKLGSTKIPKGARIFSLGNPHDIGLTLIEGTFNGFSDESFVDKIHFSGSLNPGMSGGPALDHNGQVVGLNVTTAGNQISFLVPVEKLKDLLYLAQQQETRDAFAQNQRAVIGAQLFATQKKNMEKLLSKPWESVSFQGFKVPGRIHDAFKCWGGADHKAEDPFTLFRSSCSGKDRVFLDEQFSTGVYAYNIASLSERPGRILKTRFWDLYSQVYTGPADSFRNADEENVTNFDCENSFVFSAGAVWKTSMCFRRYKKYSDLYDAHFSMARTGVNDSGFIISASLQGVSIESATAFAKRLTQEVKNEPLKAGATP